MQTTEHTTAPTEQEVINFFGLQEKSTQYPAKVLEVIQLYWPQIIESKLIDQTEKAHIPNPGDMYAPHYRIHPLLTPHGLPMLFDIATTTLESIKTKANGRCHIFALGQSPAWVVRTMEIIDQQKNDTPIQYELIAFSGGWYITPSKSSHAGEEKKLIREGGRAPKKATKTNYLQYFQQLTSRIPQNEQIFIIEFSYYMRGLCSFEDVIHSIVPKEQLQILISKPIHEYALNYFKYTILNNISPTQIQKFLNPLSICDKFDDRLVPNYPHDQWTTCNPSDFKPPASANLLIEIIKHYASLRTNKR